MRIQTTPLYKEIAHGENSTAQIPLDRLSSILESKYKIDLYRLEKRQQHIVPPWWTPPFTRIAESPEIATKEHNATGQEAMHLH
jgi:hypothetical protein